MLQVIRLGIHSVHCTAVFVIIYGVSLNTYNYNDKYRGTARRTNVFG